MTGHVGLDIDGLSNALRHVLKYPFSPLCSVAVTAISVAVSGVCHHN